MSSLPTCARGRHGPKSPARQTDVDAWLEESGFLEGPIVLTNTSGAALTNLRV